MDFEYRGPGWWQCCLVGCCWISSPAEAQLRLDDDAIRGAALTHLATALFPADPNPARPHCVGLFDHDIDKPPPDSAGDPSPALLERVRQTVPQATPVSACTLRGPVLAWNAEDVLARRPIVYYAGAVRRNRVGAAVTIAYWLHGLNGGGWACDLARARGRWTVRDCRPLWIS